MQVIIIAGNVGKDAVLRRTQSGDSVLGFSLAVDNGKDKDGNKRDTTWVDCSVWGKRAESLEQYVTKGTKLTISGRPTVRAHEGKAYLGVSVNELTFMGGGHEGGSNSGYRDNSQTGAANPDDMGDEVPF